MRYKIYYRVTEVWDLNLCSGFCTDGRSWGTLVRIVITRQKDRAQRGVGVTRDHISTSSIAAVCVDTCCGFAGICTAQAWRHVGSYSVFLFFFYIPSWRRDSSVGVATRYDLDGPGIESRRRGEVFPTCSDRHWDPPNFLYNGYLVFPGVKAVGAWRCPPTPIWRRG